MRLNWKPRIPRGVSHASKLWNWLLSYHMWLFSSHLKGSFSQGTITAVLPVLSYGKHFAILWVTSRYSLEGKAGKFFSLYLPYPSRSTLNQEMKSWLCRLGVESWGHSWGLDNRLKCCESTEGQTGSSGPVSQSSYHVSPKIRPGPSASSYFFLMIASPFSGY